MKLSPREIESVAELLHALDGADAERSGIARALALMHAYAGEQTPTRFDRPGNFDDDFVNGRMDCIDHSSNSTTYLNFLQSRGWLKYHRVLSSVRRAPWLLNTHWAARIADEKDREFAVDSWQSERGAPVPVVPLDAWLRGADG
jgi:hypothetical protein